MGGADIGVYYLEELVGVVGEGVRLSVGLMIIMRVRRLLRIGDAIPTYVLFFFFLFLPPDTHADE